MEKTAPQRTPVIWGDGMRDDSAGLQALFDGRPFKWKGVGESPKKVGDTVYLPAATFRGSGLKFPEKLRGAGPLKTTLDTRPLPTLPDLDGVKSVG